MSHYEEFIDIAEKQKGFLKQINYIIERKNDLGIREYECSVCGHRDNKHTAIRGHYCWYCGSKMDDIKYLGE